jgi:hypothetical protein
LGKEALPAVLYSQRDWLPFLRWGRHGANYTKYGRRIAMGEIEKLKVETSETRKILKEFTTQTAALNQKFDKVIEKLTEIIRLFESKELEKKKKVKEAILARKEAVQALRSSAGYQPPPKVNTQ